MTPEWVEALFPNGRDIVYVSKLAGREYSKQWTIYRGCNGSGFHELEFLLELDPAAMGAGGAVVKQRSRLTCDDALTPSSYVSEVYGARCTIRFEQEQAEIALPDGSLQTLPLAGAQFLATGDVPGLMALVLVLLARTEPGLDEGRSIRLFLGDQLNTVPLELTPAPDLGAGEGVWYRTSHQSEILLDAQGVMRLARFPSKGVETALDLSGSPVPEWPNGLEPDTPRLRYIAPTRRDFELEDVIIPGPVTPIGATLSIPNGGGLFPGVLFVGGSGTHDRHGITPEVDIGTHEVMDRLADRGFLGLRYDTRGAGRTRMGSDALDRGLRSDIADAHACLNFLFEYPSVDRQRCFVIGHSQGGTIALALAADTPTLSGVVLMAPMGRDIDQIAADQLESHGRVIGLSNEQIRTQIEDIRHATDLIKSGREWQPGEVPDYLLAMFRSRTWLAELLAFRPADLIAAVRCPVLLCQGGKDFQISAERDAEPILAAARKAGVDCTYAFFPDLDHLFKWTEGESTLATYFDRSRGVDGEFLNQLAQWLREHSG